MYRKVSYLYYIVFIILLFTYAYGAMFITNSVADAISGLIISIIFFLSEVRKGRKFNYKIVFIVLIILIIMLFTRQINTASLLLIIMLGIVANDNSTIVNQATKFYLKFNMILFGLVVVLYFSIGFNDHIKFNMWRIDSTILRHGIGFSHPNQAMLIWLGVALGVLAMVNKKNAFRLSIMILLSTYGVFHFTQSRTASYVIYFLCFLIIFFKNSLEKPLSKVGKLLLMSFPVLCASFSYVLIFAPYNRYLDVIVSGRIALYKMYFRESGFSWFGNSDFESAMIDNSYIQSLITKGAVFTFAFILIIIVLIHRSNSLTRQDAIILIGFFMVALAETMFFKLNLLLLVILIIFRNVSESKTGLLIHKNRRLKKI